jgi:hypothetical protein
MPDMMTPDGRIVSIPDGFEGHFAGLTLPPQPQPPPQPSPMAEAQPGLGVPAATLDAAASQPPPEPLPPPVAVETATPPVTQHDIATMDEAGPLNAELGALDKAKEAAQRLGTAQANQALAVGAVEASANDEADRQLAQIRANAEANAKAVQDATDAYMRNAKALANVRVDRSIDHPVLSAVGTALNILGTAMKKADMSQVMKPVYDAIDRKVAAQMQDIELGRANLGLQRESLAMLRQAGNDKMTLQQTLMLSGLEQAKRRVQEIKDKSTSPIVKAQADRAMADIEGRQANVIGTYQARYQQRQDAAAARAQAERLARAQMSVTMRGQDLDAQGRLDSIAAQIALARDSAAAQATAKGQIKAAEDIQKRAIGGEITPVKDDKGNTIGFKTGLIRQKETGEIWIPNGTDQTISDLQKQQPAAAALIGTIDEIRRLGPEWLSDTLNTDKKQQLDQLFSTAKTQATAVLGLGVPTGRDIELATGSLGTSNPTRFKDSLAGLNKARETFVRVQNERLRAAGLDHDWAPTDLGAKGSTKSPGDEIRDLLLSKPQSENEVGRLLERKRAGLAGRERTDEARYHSDMISAYDEYKKRVDPGASIEQQDKIEELRKKAIGGDREAEDAISILKDVAKNGATKSIRKRAQDALDSPVRGSSVESPIPDVLKLR